MRKYPLTYINEINMDMKLLQDPERFPSKEVLKEILGEVYDVLE